MQRHGGALLVFLVDFVATASKSNLQQIAFTIRDWLGPFYTLGGFIAFLILLLSVLDPSGRLLQLVQVFLLVATGLSLVGFFLLRERLGTWGERFFALHGHWLLCIVSVFFAAGLVISHWIQRTRQEPAAPPAVVAAPAPAAQAVSAPLATVAPAPPAAAPPATALHPATPSPSSVQATPAAKPPERTTAARPSPVVPRLERPSPAAKAGPPDPRCSSLLQRLSLGETLGAGDMGVLRHNCGS